MIGTIVVCVIAAALIGLYVWMFLYARKRQRAFDEQYNAMKERREVFVLSKRVTRERPQSKWLRFARFKNYQVVGRVMVSQAVKGIQVSRMQTVTFHTIKQEYDKIQPNHKYKMDIAGNYIGYVVAPPAGKKVQGTGGSAKAGKGKGGTGGPAAESARRRWFRLRRRGS